MEREKDLIERCVILPLAEQEEARRHGVDPASAVMLFGPPGTGKTTFAKGIAGAARVAVRRDLPEPPRRRRRARPRRCAARAPRAAALPRRRRRLHRRGRGDRVESAHAARDARDRERAPQARAALPRRRLAAPRVRDQLDPRPRQRLHASRPLRLSAAGRPSRPRGARGHLGALRLVDHGRRGRRRRLAARSQYFSAADIEFAARKAAQAAFERSLAGGFAPAQTDDFLAAIAQVRPSISTAMAREFEDDIEHFARFCHLV